MADVRKAALIGGGVIGAGWAARLVHCSVDVALFDPDSQAERKVGEVMANAERAWAKLLPGDSARKGELTLVGSVAEAVAGADYIQESAPERLELKQRLFAEIDETASPDALICSSTSGLLPTELQEKMARPERLLVAHPFNPVYLLPLVELVPGAKTAPELVERARSLFTSLGMKPLVVRKEIAAFIADRLMEALWREALWLVHDGIATTQEVDDAIRYGCGLRWAQMGTFQVFTVAGGEAGMRHFMAQFGPALKWPWTKLMDVPEMTDELVDRIAKQCDEQSAGRSVRELERIRDDNLVAILHALKGNEWGAGEVLKDFEARRAGAPSRA